MFMLKRKTFLFLLFSCYIFSCTTVKKIPSQASQNITTLKFLGGYVIPNDLNYKDTRVGGLSGIDYDALHDQYYMVSDDRSAINPARFYTAKIFFTQKGIDSVRFVKVNSMLQPNGKVYPNSSQDPLHTPDPEAIRYNPILNQLIWSSEGERIIKGKDTILENPAITIISPEGKFLDSLPVPDNLYMRSTEMGPRQNSVFEGLGFADNYKTLFVSVEEPLYEDGPRADVKETNTCIRILKYSLGERKNTAQYAYKLEPLAYLSTGYKINGVSDILALGDNKLMVIERSFSTGRLACTIRLFLADLGEASDIKNIPSLKNDRSFKPATKKLLLNMDSLGIYIDNIEGLTFGPKLPNGHKTILFIADNNFNLLQQSQLLLFEVSE